MANVICTYWKLAIARKINSTDLVNIKKRRYIKNGGVPKMKLQLRLEVKGSYRTYVQYVEYKYYCPIISSAIGGLTPFFTSDKFSFDTPSFLLIY